MKLKLTFLSLLINFRIILFLPLSALTGSDQKPHSVIVSHFRWLKNPIYLPKGIVNDKDCSYYGANTPGYFRAYEYEKYDLGQDESIKHLNKQFSDDQKISAKKTVFFGLEDSTATLTNWLAQKSHKDQEKVTAGLILCNVLGNGNHAIQHTVSSRQFIAPLSFLPFSRLWLPLLAKGTVLPSYNPLGVQALSSAKKLSANIPVIIIHERRHPDFPINDARKYYRELKAQGNTNAYLMELATDDSSGASNLEALQAIYRKHRLPVDQDLSSNTPIDFKKFQPEISQIDKQIKATNGYQPLIRNLIDLTCGAAIIGGLYYKYSKKK